MNFPSETAGEEDEQLQFIAADVKAATKMQEIGRKLLQSVGFASPDDVSIQLR
jgi:hypothetical protein